MTIIAVVVGLATYYLYLKIFFEDSTDFVDQLRDFVMIYPLMLVLDYALNWSPSSSKFSWRIFFWFPSGLTTGLLAYKMLGGILWE